MYWERLSREKSCLVFIMTTQMCMTSDLSTKQLKTVSIIDSNPVYTCSGNKGSDKVGQREVSSRDLGMPESKCMCEGNIALMKYSLFSLPP